jgi:LPS-assembly protein
MLALCHLQMRGQALTNAAPPAAPEAVQAAEPGLDSPAASALPDDPSQQILPVAQPEAIPETGYPVELSADHQSWAGNVWTGAGRVEVHYRDYVLRADKVVYHQSTTELEAEGNLQVTGGANDIHINADHGDMRLNMHTARFFNVHGSQGVRNFGRSTVYSTTNPLLFSARVILQTGEGHYRIIDGTMTNCRLPKPDWEIISRAIKLEDDKASTTNAWFKFLGVPIFYLPYLRHPADETGRVSGFLIPVISTGSSVRGYTFGEQAYWVINRSVDLIVGTEYFSKRGWAPNGDFRYKGQGLDHLTARWNALLDRGIELPSATDPSQVALTDQGGMDITVLGRKDITSETRLAGKVDYLSSYVYRLVFNDNYRQAVSSEVQSNHSPKRTRALFPLSRWSAFRPLPARPPAAARPRSTATRREFCICPMCASTCWTGRWARRRSTGAWGRRSAIWAAPSPVNPSRPEAQSGPASTPATPAASTSIRIWRFR